MSEQTPYDVEIKALEEEHTRIGGELAEARLRRAKFLCPYKVGDILVNKNRRRAEVTEIYSGYNGYRLEGAIIRKDGTPGRITRLYEFDDWNKEEEDYA